MPKRIGKSVGEQKLDSQFKVLSGPAKCRASGHDLDSHYKFDERYQACPRCGKQFDMREMEKPPDKSGWFSRAELGKKALKKKGA